MKNFLQKWGPLMIFCSAMLIMVIDTTMMNVSISAIVNDLGTTVGSIQNAITIYSLVMAAFMITGAKLGEKYGMKKVFLTGTVIYGCGTLTAAISQNILELALGWSILEGLASAAMMPIVMTLILLIYKGKDRILAFALVSGVQAGASALGPIVGGFLTTYFSWRYGFALELLFVAFILIAGPHLLKESSPNRKLKLDFGGIFLSAVSLATLVGGVILASNYGFWTPSTDVNFLGISPAPFVILAGVLLFAGFYFYEKAQKSPLVDVRIFRNGKFIVGISSALLQSLLLAGVMFIAPVFLQKVLGYSAMQTGLVVLPLSFAVLASSLLAPHFVEKHEPKALVQWGCILTGLGVYLLRGVWAVDMSGWDMTPGYILLGLGIGLVLSQLNNLSLSSVEPKLTSEASGVNNTARNLGSSLGTAVVGAIFFGLLSVNFLHNIESNYAMDSAQAQNLVDSIQEKVDTMGSEEDFLQTLTPEQKQKAEDFANLAGDSVVDTMYDTYNVILLFALASLILSIYLPTKKELKS